MITVGGVGVLAWTLTVFFVFAYPQLVLPEAARPAYFDAWFHPIAAVGDSITNYAVPLLVAVGGYHFVRTNRASATAVLVWFAVGAVAFAVLVTGLGWLVSDPGVRFSTAEYASQAGVHVVRIVGATVVGVLAAIVFDARGPGAVE